MAKRSEGSQSRPSTADIVFETLRPVVAGLGETLGTNYELVLHDFRNPDASVVAIHGSLTGRHVGGAMSEIGLEMLRQGDQAEDQLNYLLRVQGRTVRSTSIPLRDENGHVFGAMCLNVDVTQFQLALNALRTVVGEITAPPAEAMFSDDIGQVIESIVHAEQERSGEALSYEDPASRRRVIKALDERGLFRLSSAANRIAEHLGVSRATVYKDLRAGRPSSDDTGSDTAA